LTACLNFLQASNTKYVEGILYNFVFEFTDLKIETEVETCCQIKDKTLTSRVYDYFYCNYTRI